MKSTELLFAMMACGLLSLLIFSINGATGVWSGMKLAMFLTGSGSVYFLLQAISEYQEGSEWKW